MKKYLILLLSTFFLQQQAQAGFPIGKGKYLLVPSYNLYQAKGYWDRDRKFTPYNNGGRFTSHYFGIYGGLGIGEKLDFVANVSYVLQRSVENNFSSQNASLGDASFGLQYLLNSFDYYRFLTVSGSLIVPLYSNDPAKLPYTGFQQTGAEVKLGYSGTNRERLANTYYDITGGVRQFFSAEGPTQFFADVLFGVPLDEDNKLTFSFNTVKSSSASDAFNPNNLGLNRQFSYFRLQAGYGRAINSEVQLFVNIFQDIAGTNTGKGSGGSLSLVAKISR